MVLLALTWQHYLFMSLLMPLSIFMVLIILVQRGRGGGLTGALGGMGGQSAFGTKAGDLFTRITIVVAAIWVLLAMASLKVLNPNNVAGYNPNLRGTATPTSSKTMDGGLLPGAATPETPLGKAAESPGPALSPATPDAPSAPTTPDAGAKPADASKP